METVTLPNLNLANSRVGLGTWAIGGWMWGGTDEKKSIDTIISALERGINLIDTAPAYGFGKSEEIVGKAMAQYRQRERIVLSTKAGLEWKGDEVFRNASKERLLKEIDDSLKRLKTDYIDVYHVHWPDPVVPIEETAETMYKILEAGKIKAIGVSNYSIEEMETFMKEAPLHVSQPPYNLFEREITETQMPFCKDNDIAMLAYGSLCRGLLSGKMSEGCEFEGDDLRKMDPKFQTPKFKEYLKAVDDLDQFAQNAHNKRVIHLAVRWMLDSGVEVALWGARRPNQLEAVDELWNWSLSQEDMAEIEQILDNNIEEPVGPEFMAPPSRE
ncbi:MAG: aldo/keto reductase [candidate division Zixibacteria bacterium]|nr:aldo/keto reductase [candidate division Zixibacteria bacterium]NIR66111.1 aldo/keto reductase [candidate division Zixibacteria bacterium]NIS17429.1 aldo/keto reductase [candidate division Zixibacteria bacterium]NIS47732.1 aldo/keto reductase [candidate division Zixibacteria bacterium]NIT53757.1 aldo/keto reductase [candidate division Zixibacteria bacterium]